MAGHLSERFHDHERADIYLDLVQSSLDRPIGSEQAYFLDGVSSLKSLPAKPKWVAPRISLRWFALPRLPLPFLTWA
jgi:hypothetical protein